jgi:GNAT superfamily N-acetyltransferase
MSAYVMRRAGVGDAAVIAGHRAKMFRDMGDLPAAHVDALCAATAPWIAERLARGAYVGWLVEHGTQVVAGGGVLVSDLWPTPRTMRAGRLALVASVYTESDHRRQGLAKRLMETILAWCADNAIDVVTLAASPEGRPLYEQLGFIADSRAMRLCGSR